MWIQIVVRELNKFTKSFLHPYKTSKPHETWRKSEPDQSSFSGHQKPKYTRLTWRFDIHRIIHLSPSPVVTMTTAEAPNRLWHRKSPVTHESKELSSHGAVRRSHVLRVLWFRSLLYILQLNFTFKATSELYIWGTMCREYGSNENMRGLCFSLSRWEP